MAWVVRPQMPAKPTDLLWGDSWHVEQTPFSESFG